MRAHARVGSVDVDAQHTQSERVLVQDNAQAVGVGREAEHVIPAVIHTAPSSLRTSASEHEFELARQQGSRARWRPRPEAELGENLRSETI